MAAASPARAAEAVVPSRAYRRLALVTALSTAALIVLGGVVRVSESGLGCGPAGSGLDGWPLCRGDIVPGFELNTAIEFAHRLAASAVGLMILALAVLGWLRYRERRGLVRAAIGALALVAAQGLLGAATVEENLDERLVAAHLGLAMLLLALTLYIVRASRPEAVAAVPAGGGSLLRALAVAAQVAIFLTIVAGGYMAGTQNYGRADYQPGAGAHHACGKQSPTCNGELLPFGETRLVDIHLTHRVLMYIASALVIALVVTALRRRPSRGVVAMAWAALGLLLVQITLGALNVWLDEYELLIVAHLAGATLLWGSLVGLGLQLYPVGAPAPRARSTAPRERAGRRAAYKLPSP